MTGKVQSIDKVTALLVDLDDTLWSGTLAEQDKIFLKHDFFSFLCSLHKEGIQLFILSKNDEQNVLHAFEELHIDKNLFTAIIANWDPKYLNIERLLEQTQLRPETVIFIDDNPLEREEVSQRIPAIFCLDAKDWNEIQMIPYLVEAQEQEFGEIEERKNRYRTSLRSFALRAQYTEDEAFLKSLKRELVIGQIGSENLDRFTRMLIVTHRINFNPDKFSDYNETLRYLYERFNAGDRFYAVSTRENTIPLGLTGVFVVEIQKNAKHAIVVDGTFSCGILGRDFEQKALLMLIESLSDEVEEVDFLIAHTTTNDRVRVLLEEIGCSVAQENGHHIVYRINVHEVHPKRSFDWIKGSFGTPEMEYCGIHSVRQFFEKEVLSRIEQNDSIVNLGSARGEVLGHLNVEIREAFYEFLRSKNVHYLKVDLEHVEGEENILGNAENLRGTIADHSQNMVWAIELLEHTQHFWNVLDEMARMCKTGGYLFISVPFFQPKHEYPIDLWRFSMRALKSFFVEPDYTIIAQECEGRTDDPFRVMLLIQKNTNVTTHFSMPNNGKTDWQTGLTTFQ